MTVSLEGKPAATSTGLDRILGRISDVDSHESLPMTSYPEAFGEPGQRFLEQLQRILAGRRSTANQDRPMEVAAAAAAGRSAADMEITTDTVWGAKRTFAAVDMGRRVETLDAMGIERALIFPGFALFAFVQALGGGFNSIPVATEEDRAVATSALGAYNEWAGHYTNANPDRLRIAGVLASSRPGLTPDGLVKETENLLSTGVKAVMIASGQPPAGVSPADPVLDPFYAMLAEKNIALVLHPPSGAGIRKTDVWGIVPDGPGDYTFPIAISQGEENFLTAMVLGGVFERHPTLRVGTIESGAFWIGPLAERLDTGFARRTPALPMLPSEYLNRNVRVSLLLDEFIERPGAKPARLDVWLERYPNLLNCYCYSSDLPHVEGGEWSLAKFYDVVAPFGEDIVEQVFVTNGRFLLP